MTHVTPVKSRAKQDGRQAQRLAKADVEALIRDNGAEAYGEARRRERDAGSKAEARRNAAVHCGDPQGRPL